MTTSTLFATAVLIFSVIDLLLVRFVLPKTLKGKPEAVEKVISIIKFSAFFLAAFAAFIYLTQLLD